jgi:uncharacterized protein YutE (UPF0331/DUF86 family)
VIDRNRVARALADLVTTRDEITQLAATEQTVFLADRRNSLALRYLIIQAVEAVADICQHILAQQAGIICEGYVDCIVKAGTQGIISAALAQPLRRLAALRNMLVHRYWIADDIRLYVETRAHQHDLDTFRQDIEIFLQQHP